MKVIKIRQFLFAVVSLCLSTWVSAETYTYDNLNRLTAFALPTGAGQTYSYDAAGNLLALVSTSPVVNYTLSVTRSGTGSGTVTGSGINCGSSCSTSLAGDASVILAASAASGSTFAGWSGDCSGLSACVLTMNTNKSVTASFTADTTGGGSGGSGGGGSGGGVTQTLSVVAGWNLLGNGLNRSIGVAELGNTSQINSIWTWQSTTSRWAFYAPSLSTTELAAYAQSKTYDVLTAIGPNEGFWVNAKQAATLHSLTGTAQALVLDALPHNWSLVGSGVSQTPAEFNASSTTQPGVVTLWAWETTQNKWLFYAPSLVNQGGSALTDYLLSKGYLDFTLTGRSLGLGTGFWINRP